MREFNQICLDKEFFGYSLLSHPSFLFLTIKELRAYAEGEGRGSEK
jgi:hypothetical protein